VQCVCRDSLISDDHKKDECRQVKLFCVTKPVHSLRQTGPCGLYIHNKHAYNSGLQIYVVLIFTKMYYGEYQNSVIPSFY
jgi:hypothetical protein